MGGIHEVQQTVTLPIDKILNAPDAWTAEVAAQWWICRHHRFHDFRDRKGPTKRGTSFNCSTLRGRSVVNS